MVREREEDVKVYLWNSLADGRYWEQLFRRTGVASLLVSYAKERFLKKSITETRREHRTHGQS